MVIISIKNYNQVDITNSLLVIGLFEDNDDLNYLKKITSIDLHKKIKDTVITISETIKKFGKNLLFLYKDDNNEYLRILLIGLGKYDDLDHTKIRQIGGIISIKARELDSQNIVVSNFYKTNNKNVETIVEGLSLSLYEFNKYKGNNDNTPNFSDSCTIDLISEDGHLELEQIVKKTLIIVESICYARDLANSPPNILTPSSTCKFCFHTWGYK